MLALFFAIMAIIFQVSGLVHVAQICAGLATWYIIKGIIENAEQEEK